MMIKDNMEEMRGRIMDSDDPDYVNYEPLLTPDQVLLEQEEMK